MSILPTNLDNLNAMMYAMDKVAKEKCDAINAKYPDIEWELRDENRMYSCPTQLTNCSSQHGKCRIKTKEECLKLSQLPWSPNGGNISDSICKEDIDCAPVEKIDMICGNNNKCIPKNVYLEWREDENKEDENKESGKCILGNSLLRKYCEFPITRDDHHVKGKTDVPPFRYSPETGECFITKKYCDWMGSSYRTEGFSKKPNCFQSKGDTVGQFVVGKTIFKGMKTGFKEFYKNIPISINKLADKKLMDNYKILKENFGGPGIHLYQIIWKKEAEKIDKTTINPSAGFIATEIHKVYPNIIIKQKNFLFIVISMEQLKSDPSLKRIYIGSASGKSILDTIINSIKK